MRILVYSCIRKVDRIGMRERGQSCAARPREEGRHAVSKIRRAVSMKISVEDRERQQCGEKREGLKTVSQRRGVDETKSFRFHPVQENCMSEAPPHMCSILHTYMGPCIELAAVGV